MNLTTPSDNPKNLQRQIELFKQLKVEHDKQLKQLTKGQDIAQLEARARKMLEDAKAEAASIIAKAKRGVEQVEKSKDSYEALKSDLEKAKNRIVERDQAAAREMQHYEQLRSEVGNNNAKLKKDLADCAKTKERLKGKIEELKEILVRFSGSIN